MRVKFNGRIQKAVDRRKGSDLSRLAAMQISASGELLDTGGPEAHANGVADGLALATAYHNAANKEVARGGLASLIGIYLATQETSEGEDRLYFVGTPDSIMAKINRIPEAQKSTTR